MMIHLETILKDLHNRAEFWRSDELVAIQDGNDDRRVRAKQSVDVLLELERSYRQLLDRDDGLGNLARNLYGTNGS